MTVWEGIKIYLGIGLAIYFSGFYWAYKGQVDDINPYPFTIILVPVWPLALLWGAICFVLTKLQIGPFKD